MSALSPQKPQTYTKNQNTPKPSTHKPFRHRKASSMRRKRSSMCRKVSSRGRKRPSIHQGLLSRPQNGLSALRARTF